MKWLINLTILRRAITASLVTISRIWSGFTSQFSRFRGQASAAWNQMPRFWRHFTTNFIIGAVIAVVLHLAHHTSWISQAENLASDSMMVLNQGLPRMAIGDTNRTPLHLTFLEIDEDSYRTWNEPFHIPRDKLLRLIQFAADGDARAIVVDVDVTKETGNDEDLLTFLGSYKENQPPLFLLRTFYPKSKKYTENKDYVIRPSILDKLDGANNIHWVHPQFKLSAYDQSLRYWQLLAIGCLGNRPVSLPAIQLLVDVQLSAPKRMPEILKKIRCLSPVNCTEIEEAISRLSGELHYANKQIELDNTTHRRVGERIIYTLPWAKTSTEELLWLPAYKITESTKPLSNSAVEDRVVVIGASFADTRDLYKTPLGVMPGGMVVINAIKSLYLYGQTKPPLPGFKFLLELCLIALMSWAFARFSSASGAIITTIVILIVLLPISFYFFKYGVWVDLAIPLLAMQFHQLVAQYDEKVAMRRRSRGKPSEHH